MLLQALQRAILLDKCVQSELPNAACSLTDPPRGNDTLHLRVDVTNQRGNAIDVIPHVLVGPREKFFTAADYGVQFTTWVNLTGLYSTSSADLFAALIATGIVQAGVVAYHACAPIICRVHRLCLPI